MKTFLVLAVGIFLGWALGIIKPPPQWFSSQIENICHLTHQKVETKLEKTTEKVEEKFKKKFEASSKKLEKKLRK